MLLDDHDLVAMTMPPALMPAAVMSVFGTRATIAMIMTMIATTLDHDSFSARNRRRRDNDRAKRIIPNFFIPSSSLSAHSTAHRGERSRGT